MVAARSSAGMMLRGYWLLDYDDGGEVLPARYLINPINETYKYWPDYENWPRRCMARQYMKSKLEDPQ
jgi:hypothetical protein